MIVIDFKFYDCYWLLYYPVLSLIPKYLIKREDKEIFTKELRKLTLKTSEVSFDEGINIKRGMNDQGFDLLFWVMFLANVPNVHDFGFCLLFHLSGQILNP